MIKFQEFGDELQKNNCGVLQYFQESMSPLEV